MVESVDRKIVDLSEIEKIVNWGGEASLGMHNSRVTILRDIYGSRDPRIMRVSTIYQSYSTPDNNFIRGLRGRWRWTGMRRDARMSAPLC